MHIKNKFIKIYIAIIPLLLFLSYTSYIWIINHIEINVLPINKIVTISNFVEINSNTEQTENFKSQNNLPQTNLNPANILWDLNLIKESFISKQLIKDPILYAENITWLIKKRQLEITRYPELDKQTRNKIEKDINKKTQLLENLIIKMFKQKDYTNAIKINDKYKTIDFHYSKSSMEIFTNLSKKENNTNTKMFTTIQHSGKYQLNIINLKNLSYLKIFNNNNEIIIEKNTENVELKEGLLTIEYKIAESYDETFYNKIFYDAKLLNTKKESRIYPIKKIKIPKTNNTEYIIDIFYIGECLDLQANINESFEDYRTIYKNQDYTKLDANKLFLYDKTKISKSLYKNILNIKELKYSSTKQDKCIIKDLLKYEPTINAIRSELILYNTIEDKNVNKDDFIAINIKEYTKVTFELKNITETSNRLPRMKYSRENSSLEIKRSDTDYIINIKVLPFFQPKLIYYIDKQTIEINPLEKNVLFGNKWLIQKSLNENENYFLYLKLVPPIKVGIILLLIFISPLTIYILFKKLIKWKIYKQFNPKINNILKTSNNKYSKTILILLLIGKIITRIKNIEDIIYFSILITTIILSKKLNHSFLNLLIIVSVIIINIKSFIFNFDFKIISEKTAILIFLLLLFKIITDFNKRP